MHVKLFLDGRLERNIEVRTRKQGQAVCEAWMMNPGQRTAYLKGYYGRYITVLEAWPKERPEKTGQQARKEEKPTCTQD